MQIDKVIKIAPAIKWSGSKRSQVPTIMKHIPNFKKYYEPFIGGGSVAYAVLPQIGICGDSYSPLIEFWKKVKDSPEELAESYYERWNQLQDEGHLRFYEIRDRFNLAPNAEDLLFLSRTCVTGLIRFNKNGEFNNALHHTRKGINPATLHTILVDWSKRMQGITFMDGDYRSTAESITKDDFIYLDPPYFNNKSRYLGTIDYESFLEFLAWLNSKGVKYALSYDGGRGEKSYLTHHSANTTYYVTFEVESGDRMEFKVSDKEYGMLAEGDKGKLTFQGSRYKEFTRIKSDAVHEEN